MNDHELARLLSEKTQPAPRKNVTSVLTPDISRNAARLKKRRQDRIQALACALVGALFIALSAALIFLLRTAENPETILRPALFLLAGGMTSTLLLAPVLAWHSDKEVN